MSESTKKRVHDAIAKYIDKQTPKYRGRASNAKPEKEVERLVMEWCKNKGWFVQILEAKGVFDPSVGRWLSGRVLAGTSDIVGILPNGIFLAIELKAPGCRNRLMPKQRDYLLKVISMNGFACVVDSVDELSSTWDDYFSSENKKAVLVKRLPKEKQVLGTSPLFED